MIAGQLSGARGARHRARSYPLGAALGLLGIFVIAATPLTFPLAAQAISGTLVDAESGAPIEGASVVLLSRAGEHLDQRVSDAAGRFDFRMQRAGTYLLQANRIGHAGVLSEPIPIDRGVTVVYRLEAPVQAITLAGIDVRSSRRCEVRPGQGASTALVWEEARKALEATSRTSGLGVYRYEIRRFERELDARGRRVRNEQSRIERRVLGSPFASLDVDDLLETGFVRREDEGSSYYAPDADVLLSDAFLDTHCMRLTEGEDEAEGLLGLAFEPTRDRGVPDISGVLWVDPHDGELRWLDYGYEFLDVPNSDRLGGQVRFEGLPDGTWIVRDWYIRMPLLRASFGGGRVRSRLTGIREEGGVVLRVDDLRGEPVLDSETGIIRGVVLDVEDSEPVEGVVVLLGGPGDNRRATTDRDGRFQFADLVEGYYGLTVFDPVLESLGLSPERIFLDVRAGDVASVPFRIRVSGPR